MPLSAIINRFATVAGLQQSTTAQRNYCVTLANNAARALFDQYELRSGNREQIFNIGTNQQQVTFPWYVDRILAARDYDYRSTQKQVDMRARYQSSDWLGYDFNTWRSKQRNVATEREILNAGPLTITFAAPLTVALAVTIVGETTKSARLTERVNFAVGDTEHTTTASWRNVESINKPNTSLYDVTITDIDGNTLAFIPSFGTKSAYTLLQVQDRFQLTSPSRLMEVLYRPIFRPFELDTDTFVCGDIYDDAIYWKCLELFYATRSDATSVELAVNARRVCEVTINKIAESLDDGQQAMINFGSNPTMNAMTQLRYDGRFDINYNMPGSF